jgi:hypothetical protein
VFDLDLPWHLNERALAALAGSQMITIRAAS